jgi:hypothetical protein
MTSPETIRHQREQELAKSNRPRLGSPFTTKVVGVSFIPAYPDNLWALDRAQAEAERKGEPLRAVLVRNPDNEHDPNAIQVHVPALGHEWGFVGHLTAPIAMRMAPEIDDGGEWEAAIVSVLIDERFLDRPGISIECRRAPEQETE